MYMMARSRPRRKMTTSTLASLAPTKGIRVMFDATRRIPTPPAFGLGVVASRPAPTPEDIHYDRLFVEYRMGQGIEAGCCQF